MSKTDPFVTVTLCMYEDGVTCSNDGIVTAGGLLVLRDLGSKHLNGDEICRTEVVEDNLNPDFHTSFKVDYVFEKSNTILMIKVYDEDKKGSKDLKDHELVGTSYLTIGQLMGAPSNVCTRALRKAGTSDDLGSVTLRAEEVCECLDTVTLQFGGLKLANKDGFFGKSDPFLQIKRCNEDGSYTLVHKTEVVMDNLSPTWKEETLSVSMICNNDYHRPLRLQVYDWDKDGSHDDMGFVDTSLASLVASAGRPEGRLKVLCGGKQAGQLETKVARVDKKEAEPTLATYMSAGLQLSLMVAVDYTASNGKTTDPASLHFLGPSGSGGNQYQQAIEQIGGILEPYDSDRKFPIWGYGGFGEFSKGEQKHTSHCFELAGSEVVGAKGLLDAYSSSFEADYALQLSGPTNFAPVILKAREHAKAVAEANGGQAYSVLLIITDGEITDMKETKHAIIGACEEPISVIIVGVGNCEFKKMTILDGDGEDGLTTKDGMKASRDIVQFVPFRDFKDDKEKLATATLAEFPAQVIEYLKSKNIQPKKD
ncbi:hypothetical protein TrCOL_g13282 [Triparma columacea]|uniref:C2 domain-containing protein n=1 Tax=Triparma columacea TaxID=722753 RepID=A0A9W7FXR1_9STRA|nr:hypothetical protein TrCOL_g13282 [Triparma columacea]